MPDQLLVTLALTVSLQKRGAIYMLTLQLWMSVATADVKYACFQHSILAILAINISTEGELSIISF